MRGRENQKTLYENIKDYFEGMEQGEMPEDIWEGEEEKGRVERREIRTVTGLERLEKREAWQDVKTIVQYRTFRMEKGKETVQTDRYYLSSGDFSADEFLKYIRGHWSIENQLHWMLDITFREDECRVRTGNGAVNLNILRKDGVAAAEEDEDGKKTGQRQTPHDARRCGFGFPVSGIVLKVNADALIFLNVGEVPKLADTELGGDLGAEVRRAFIFVCYTGLRISDIKKP